MEEKISFLSEGMRIEGLLGKNRSSEGVVVTHPHPLYGGEMRNSVVEAVVNAFDESGYSTLRFNFRGVGESQGFFDNGEGEQQDVISAVSFMETIGIEKIHLAGYSFGSWVNALCVAQDIQVEGMYMISPPVAFIDFGTVRSLPCLKYVISGSLDDFAPARLIGRMLPAWNPEAVHKVIEGADHFYGGYHNVLKSAISDFHSGSVE